MAGWLQGAGWGLLSASGLLIGAVGGYYRSLQHTSIARAMTFAASVLLAVVAVDGDQRAWRDKLALDGDRFAVRGGGVQLRKLVTLAPQGTASKTLRRMRRAAGGRTLQPGSGLAIAAGTFLDGVPEGVVLGLSVLHKARPVWGRLRRSSWRISRKHYRAAPECDGRDDPRVRVWRVEWNRLVD